MTSISVKQYKGTTGKCQDSNSYFNAVFTSKSFSHFEIVVFVPLLNDRWGSQLVVGILWVKTFQSL